MTSAAEVQKKIRKRRQISDVNDFLDHHEKAKNFMQNIEDVSLWMANAVGATLGVLMEDLNTGPGDFRNSLQRSCRRVLAAAAAKTERVIFFNEAIPGFTVLAIKKEGWGTHPAPSPSEKSSAKSKDAVKEDKVLDDERNQAVQGIIESYVNRTGNRVMAIEGSDVVLILFPVSDLKKNLEEMGFWSP